MLAARAYSHDAVPRPVQGVADPERAAPVSRPRSARRSQGKALFRFAACVAFAASLALVVADRSARVAAEAQEILALKEELRLVEAENRRLEMAALQMSSLARIEREAKDRLGMELPRKILPVPLPGETQAAFARREPPAAAPVTLPPPGSRAEASGGPAPAGVVTAGVALNAEAVAALERLGRWVRHALAGG